MVRSRGSWAPVSPPPFSSSFSWLLLASPDPDGLESVAEQGGFIDTADDHPIGGPLSDYGVAGIDSATVGTAIAGVIGVLVTFLVGLLLFRLFSRGDRSRLGPRAGPS